MKRILDCKSSDFASKPSAEEFVRAIKKAEGRVIIAEVDAETSPYFSGVSNTEILAAFGADLILIKSMDISKLTIQGSDKRFGEDAIKQAKTLVGLPVGVSLQVLPLIQRDAPNAFTLENLNKVSDADFLCLTAYDKEGITSELLIEAIQQARKHFDGMIIAAKYFSSGVATPEVYASFAEGGANAVIVPAPSSVRGSSELRVERAINGVQSVGALAITTVSSSQEGSDVDTIKAIGLASKRCGSDAANFGDAGISGIPAPECIQALSIAIRGRRHTYIRMASSIAR